MIVTNQSNVKYSYTIPGEPTQSGEEYSNPVDTEILSSAISKVKTSDRTTIGEGETARQTVVITNNSVPQKVVPHKKQRHPKHKEER